MKHNVSVGEYMASQLNYLLAELESMLTTRVSETVNRFTSFAPLTVPCRLKSSVNRTIYSGEQEKLLSLYSETVLFMLCGPSLSECK